jgi:hypothetical protein
MSRSAELSQVVGCFWFELSDSAAMASFLLTFCPFAAAAENGASPTYTMSKRDGLFLTWTRW